MGPDTGACAGRHLPAWLNWPWLGLFALSLGGCASHGFRLFHPRGPVAAAMLRFTFIDCGTMLLLILPVGLTIAVFVWRYRKRANATYDPDWSHSMAVELLIWGGPIVIVCVLAFFSYESVLQVNPYAPTSLNPPAGSAAAAADPPPLQVDVITTDWQWWFIYPQQHIATINELVVPVGRTVETRLTSTSVVNDFYIPQIAPMIDVMPSMQTQDTFRGDTIGTYTGFSADFSGAGFSWMQFATRVVSEGDFANWVKSVQQGQAQPNWGNLSYAMFNKKYAHPTINIGAKARYFSTVEPQIFDQVRAAAMQGVTYPVPADLTQKMAPHPEQARKSLQVHP